MMKMLRLPCAFIFVAILFNVLGGCASPPPVGELEDERSVGRGDHAALASFYANEARKSRLKAERYLELASTYAKIHGADSELAQHYRELAALVTKEAEEDAALSRNHQRLADEMRKALRREMLPQP